MRTKSWIWLAVRCLVLLFIVAGNLTASSRADSKPDFDLSVAALEFAIGLVFSFAYVNYYYENRRQDLLAPSWFLAPFPINGPLVMAAFGSDVLLAMSISFFAHQLMTHSLAIMFGLVPLLMATAIQSVLYLAKRIHKGSKEPAEAPDET